MRIILQGLLPFVALVVVAAFAGREGALAVITGTTTSSGAATSTKEIVLSPLTIVSSSVEEWRGGTLSVAFEIGNETSFVQPGIVWSVALVKLDAVAETLPPEEYEALASSLLAPADMRMYADTPLTLLARSNIKKTFTYAPPKHLNGAYDVYLSFSNAAGLVLGRAKAGSASFSGNGQSVRILGCYLSVNGGDIRYANLFGVDVAADERLVARCGTESGIPGDITVTPVFETRAPNMFGPKVPSDTAVQRGEAFALKENVSDFSVPVPPEKRPGAYGAVLSLERNGVRISNEIELRYVVQGKSASVVNTLLDKDAYKTGDTARVTVFWSESADRFPSSRGPGTALTEPAMSGFIQNERGERCTEKISGLLPEAVPGAPLMFVAIEAPIIRACAFPELVVGIADTTGGTEGNASGEKTFLSSVSVPVRSGNTLLKTVYANPVAAAALLALVIGGAGWMLARRRIMKTPDIQIS